MTFYIFQFIFLFIFAFIVSHTKNKNMYFFAKVICFFILFIPGAVRYGIGTDYFSYVRMFYRINSNSNYTTEGAWMFLNYFLGSHGFSYQYIFVVSSFLFCIFIMYTKKKEFLIVIIAYYCWLYFFSYNGVRNGISISMAWYAYICLLDNKRIKAYIILFLSSFFHMSSIIYIVLFLIMDYVKISKRMTIIFAIIIFIVLSKITLQDLLLILPLPKDFKYAMYLTKDSKYFVSVGGNTGWGILLRRFCIFLSYLLSSNFKNEKEKNYINWWFLALWTSDLLMTSVYIFFRILTLFYLSYMAMMSTFNFKTKNGYVTLANVFIVFYTIFISFIYVVGKGRDACVPYQTIWSVH